MGPIPSHLPMMVLAAAANPADLRAARTQMAVSLGVLFAIGAVPGTILSFELGILWPGRLRGGVLGPVRGRCPPGLGPARADRALDRPGVGGQPRLADRPGGALDRVPAGVAAAMSTMIIPLTLAAFGVIMRGSAFAFREVVDAMWLKRVFGASFAASSVLTPFFLGAVAGGVATGRVPPGNARGNLITSWLNPTSLLGGTLAVGVCAYLAAVFLVRDAERDGHRQLVEQFRARALGTGVALGVIALGGFFVLRADAPRLFDGLTGQALPLVIASAVFGLVSLWLLLRRRFVAVRVTAALAVVAIIWGWAAAQYPYMLEPDVTIEQAAAGRATMTAMLVSLGIGALLLVPSMALLFVTFQRGHDQDTRSGEARQPTAPPERA